MFTPICGQNVDLHLSDALLSELTMPALLLWGEDDPDGGAAVARSFAPRLPCRARSSGRVCDSGQAVMEE